MKKNFLLIICFLFTFNSISSACNFKISNFGDPKEKLKLEGPEPILMPDQFGGENFHFPIIDV